MLPLLRNYTLASTFRLKPSLLPFATRRLLATTPKKAGVEDSSNPSTVQKSDKKQGTKSEEKSDNVGKQEKPKTFTKKDLMPPSKRPMSSFARFALAKANEQRDNGTTPFRLSDVLRDCAAAWRNFSDAEKQSYEAPPEAYEAHRVALKNWRDSLSDDAKRALKRFRRRKQGTGHALFLSETFKQAVGNTFGEKVSERSATWRSLPDEEKEAYRKRAAETLFGVRAKRAAQHTRELDQAAKAKIKAAEKKAKEIAEKKKKLEKEKLKRAELRAKAKAKKEELKQKQKEQKLKAKQDLDGMKVRPHKETVKATA